MRRNYHLNYNMVQLLLMLCDWFETKNVFELERRLKIFRTSEFIDLYLIILVFSMKRKHHVNVRTQR